MNRISTIVSRSSTVVSLISMGFPKPSAGHASAPHHFLPGICDADAPPCTLGRLAQSLTPLLGTFARAHLRHSQDFIACIRGVSSATRMSLEADLRSLIDRSTPDNNVMESSFSPVLTNLFMEYFESELLHSASLRPSGWLRCANDVFAPPVS